MPGLSEVRGSTGIHERLIRAVEDLTAGLVCELDAEVYAISFDIGAKTTINLRHNVAGFFAVGVTCCGDINAYYTVSNDGLAEVTGANLNVIAVSVLDITACSVKCNTIFVNTCIVHKPHIIQGLAFFDDTGG